LNRRFFHQLNAETEKYDWKDGVHLERVSLDELFELLFRGMDAVYSRVEIVGRVLFLCLLEIKHIRDYFNWVYYVPAVFL